MFLLHLFVVALLERPVVLSGKRERKKVDRIDVSSGATPKEKKLEIPEGKGTALGEIPNSKLPIHAHFICNVGSSTSCTVFREKCRMNHHYMCLTVQTSPSVMSVN